MNENKIDNVVIEMERKLARAEDAKTRLRSLEAKLQGEVNDLEGRLEAAEEAYASLSQIHEAMALDTKEYRRESEALAAHVEIVKRRAQDVTEDGSSKNWTALRMDALRSPETSLARRDMLMKAEALESAIDYGFGHKEMAEVADKLRRQAEEAK